ncbi:hypothetical protein GYMLUDRAFT_60477 [Collybiopsis luxurians FD-317 M1]|uniref:Uncharacterized protein n=1 Tax=Collybiopsis luxurians FD-317 M1 TaxID=944289 RepID=A0A0D0C867_9AGAR|nr:hypothetical protein GYMLUDRAFT_60477 [Collybiopsis luxurians FD-317 M1]
MCRFLFIIEPYRLVEDVKKFTSAEHEAAAASLKRSSLRSTSGSLSSAIELRAAPTTFTPLPVTLEGYFPHRQVMSTTFGLYFNFEHAGPQRRMFKSKTVHKRRTSKATHFIDFRSVFSTDFTDHPIYTALIIADGRHYIVGGTYHDNLDDHNMALGSIGCEAEFKGDLAVFFLPKYDHLHFMRGLPRYESTDYQEEILERVISAFICNVIGHVGKGKSYSHQLSA